jgi:transposase
MYKGLYYMGLDIHKKTIAFCVKDASGEVIREGSINSGRETILDFIRSLDFPWIGAMEATMFTGFVYDLFDEQGHVLKVADPYSVKAIVAAKKKSDRLDARMLADLLRCDLLPETYMPPREIRELRQMLRFRNLLIEQAVKFKNKTSGLLMEAGAEYNKSKLHGKRYFKRLLEQLDYVPDSVLDLLKMSRASFEMFDEMQKRLIKGLREHPRIRERVERLMTIPGVGEIMALTWVLEISDPRRFRKISRAVSYCGLCSALNESAGKVRRGPLSKQRNANLQTMLVEVANLAPMHNPQLKAVYEKELAEGDHGSAVIAVARKLVAYMLAVDKSGKDFEIREAA